MAKPLVIYHGNCADGFAAAWVVWKHFAGEVDFYPGVYQRKPPIELCENRPVIVVDFSYKRGPMKEIAAVADYVLVLDHHKTAIDELKMIEDPEARLKDQIYNSKLDDLTLNWGEFAGHLEPDCDHDLYCVFSQTRSGCGLTWDFFNPGQARPLLLNHLEDRDLWKFALQNTRELQAAAFSQPYDIKVWDEMIYGAEYSDLRGDMVQAGAAIERKHFKDINELLEVVTRPMGFKVPTDFNGFTHVKNTDGSQSPLYSQVIVPVANLPYTMGSDAAHLLCERGLQGEPRPLGEVSHPEYYHHPFAAYFYDVPGGRQFGLRSRKGTGADVGAIAKLYGGGGHVNASGFFVPFERLGDFEP